MSWFSSELRVRLALLNWFKPSSKIFYWPFQGGTSFVDFFYLFVLSCVCYVFVCVCLYVLCGHLLEKSWPLGCRLCSLTEFVTFPLAIGILGQAWYLIVSIPHLCTRTYLLFPCCRFLFLPLVYACCTPIVGYMQCIVNLHWFRIMICLKIYLALFLRLK